MPQPILLPSILGRAAYRGIQLVRDIHGAIGVLYETGIALSHNARKFLLLTKAMPFPVELVIARRTQQDRLAQVCQIHHIATMRLAVATWVGFQPAHLILLGVLLANQQFHRYEMPFTLLK